MKCIKEMKTSVSAASSGSEYHQVVSVLCPVYKDSTPEVSV